MARKKEPQELTVKELASMGGKARADTLTGKRRKEIAQKAARARWEKAGDKRKPAG